MHFDAVPFAAYREAVRKGPESGKQSVRHDRDNRETWIGMTAAARKAFDEALALEQSGDLDNALVAYVKALELAPSDIEIAYRTATALLRAGYLDEAVSQLRRIVFAEPDHFGARTNLGNCQLLLGDLDNAATNFAEVLAVEPDNLNALFGLASVYLKQKRFSAAAGPAKRLLERLPESAPVLTLYAESQASGPNLTAAIAAFRKAMRIDPAYPPAVLGLAKALITTSRHDEAADLARRAHLNAPAQVEPLIILAEAHQAAGRFDRARSAFVKALEVDQGATEAKLRLCTLLRKTGDLSDALACALDAYDDGTRPSEAANALGACLSALNHKAAARAVLTSASTGKAIAPDVRATIEDLLAAGPVVHASAADPKVDEEKDAAPETGRQADVPAMAMPESDGVDDGESQEADRKPRAKPADARQGSLPLLDDDEPLPNVLGLRRQDKTGSNAG